MASATVQMKIRPEDLSQVPKSGERIPNPGIMVIFGASGDLTKRKLLPALFHLEQDGLLPKNFAIVGVARRALGDEFAADMREGIIEFGKADKADPRLEEFTKKISYYALSFDDASHYAGLKQELDKIAAEKNIGPDRLFYLATAPEYFTPIIENLGAQGMAQPEQGRVGVVIEKPFGHDLDSARALNHQVNAVFHENQVFRIDHYLGKETVQNLMALRFANALFEPVWNRNYIDNVQITAAEDIGIGGRAGYYEGAGALRDLVQNHMMQLLALLTMEPPTAFEANRLRDEKLKVLEAIVPPRVDDVAKMAVRGQYAGGVSGGKKVSGYLEEPGVDPDSHTETYAALRLQISNWRWAGVPFYLRTGKRLARKITEIAVTLKPVPHLAFQSKGSLGVQSNQIILTVQPDEGVSVSLGAKIPGPSMRIRPVNMEFRYGTAFMSESPEAYERLILDAMRGDATLFTRNDEIEALWGIIDPILTAWHDSSDPLPQYMSGSAGPEEADRLLGEGRRWRRL
jgi:glucose-6-phosphate 1-dehydrogenase